MTYLEGPQILELGSGPGHLQKILRGNGIVGMGLDESQQMLEITRRRLKRMGQSFLLVQAIGEAIPFPDSTFDQVVATFPAEFITDQDTLADIYRVLKGDGELVILRFAWLSDRHWPYKLTAWLFRLVGEAPNPKRPLQVERLMTPFRKAGFSVEIKKIELDSSGLILLLCRK